MSSGFLQGEFASGCAWSYHFWFLWWIRKETRTVPSQGFCMQKETREISQQELAHVGLGQSLVGAALTGFLSALQSKEVLLVNVSAQRKYD